MSNFTQEQYMQAFDKTPKSVKDELLSENISTIVENLVRRYNLEDDKAFVVSAFIGYTMVGLVPVSRFIEALQKETELDAETVKNIAHDIRAEIFAPAAEELANMQEGAEKNWQEAIQKSETEEEPKSLPKDESVTRIVIEDK